MINRFIQVGYITPESRILDIGCGLGRLARPLTSYLDGGEYFGMDINKEAIDWCRVHYEEYKNFKFDTIDVFSKFYNPNCTFRGSEYNFPWKDASFDFILLSSVFTHMMLDDVDRYLSEICRMMKHGGHCYSTFFLLSRKMYLFLLFNPKFFSIKGGFSGDRDVPEKVVFLREGLIRGLYKKNNMKIEEINYGSWLGRGSGGYQDEVIAQCAGKISPGL